MSNHLKGIKVLELSTFMASSICGKHLQEHGAEVIKIDPIYGDPFRTFGSTIQQAATEEENPCWQWTHANKKDIALDPSTPEGQEIIYKLLEDADVFITNYRPHSLKRAGLTYEDLKDRFPKLVYGWVTGYGLEGPWKDDPGFDGIAFYARTGWAWSLGSSDTTMLTPGTSGDVITGTNLYTGIVTSLFNRERTGKGELVDVYLYGTSLFMVAMMVTSASYYKLKFPRDNDERNPVIVSYVCKDGIPVLINLISFDRGWPSFAKEMGLEEYIGDPRFENMASVRANVNEVREIFAGAFAKLSSEDAVERCKRANCPASTLGHFKDKAEDEQAMAAGYLAPYTFASGNTYNLASNSIHYSSEPSSIMGPAPKFGEHSKEILVGLGYTPEQINEFVEKKAVGLG